MLLLVIVHTSTVLSTDSHRTPLSFSDVTVKSIEPQRDFH
jgi:hypothetical protein